jgi:putative ABC transport system permease protein
MICASPFVSCTGGPGFAFAVILTLALAVGVNAVVFSLVDGFLLRSLPYPHPERIAALVS